MTIPLPRTLQPSGNSDVARVTNALRSTSEVTLDGGPFLFLSTASIGGAATRLRFQRGATITTAAGATTTIDGDIDAGHWRIFDGPGAVRFGPNAPKDVPAAWFGTGGAAIQAAHDAIYDRGVIRTHDGGSTVATTVAISKPVRIDIAKGGLTATTGCQEVLQVSGNTHIVGLHNFESVITPLAGFPAIKAVNTWPDTVDGQASLHLERVGCIGGSSFLDLSAVTTLVEANLVVQDCRAHECTDYAVKGGTSYYGRFHRNHWNLCKGGFRLGQFTETKISENVIALAKPLLHTAAATVTGSPTTTATMAGLDASNVGDALRIRGAGAAGVDYVGTILGVSGATLTLDVETGTDVSSADAYVAGFAYLFEGVAHVDVHKDECYGWLAFSPDARIMAVNDAADGIATFRDCKFGSERRYWMREYAPVELYNPANPNFAAGAVRLESNRFYGPVFFEVTSIGGDGAHATATINTPNSTLGHGLQVGDKFHIHYCVDNRFNGQELAVTAIGSPGTSQTVSWVSTVNVGQSAQGGFVAAASLSAIRTKSPFCSLIIAGNDFVNFNYGVDDTAAVTDGSSGSQGRGEYYGNGEYGPLGTPFAAMQSVFGRGFQVVEPSAQALPQRVTRNPRELETTRIQNRVLYSEDSSQWAALGGISFSAGQADPLGGTAATKVTRAASAAIIATPPNTFGEVAAVVVDNTSLGAGGYLSFWAKAGTLNTLWIAMADASSLLPGSQRMVKLDATWRHYRIAFGINQGGGTIALRFAPGGPGVLDQTSGDLYVFGLQISDVECDYANTTGALVNDTAMGARFSRVVDFASSIKLAGGAGLGGGKNVISIANASVVPGTNPSGGGILYVEGGVLKYRGPSGTVTPIAPA